MTLDTSQFVSWFRRSAPYINAHRGRTFVVTFGGEAAADPGFAHLLHDLALLSTFGARVVVVAGARPQIEERLRECGAEIKYVNGLRITDDKALSCVKEAAGTVRVEIEALLSMGLANSPMAGLRIRVASGNYVTARPLGVRDGVDYLHTGEVRRIDAAAIRERLDSGAIVLLAPLGYSPTGEIFNVHAEEVALAVAGALRADKLIFLMEREAVVDPQGNLIREMNLAEAEHQLAERPDTPEPLRRVVEGAVQACRAGVGRVHLLRRSVEGAILLELFTRDGVGTLITSGQYEALRRARLDDVGGILELIEPLERDGTLVRRSRELLETEIDHFSVVERDGMIIACAGLYPVANEAVGEVACFAVHEDYRGGERGDRLLRHVEREATSRGISRLLVLTTRTAHWFQERGFLPGSLDDLPVGRRALYNYKRNSRVFIKTL